MYNQPRSDVDSARRGLGRRQAPSHKLTLAFVLWRGDIGGAEIFSLKLASELRRLGAEVTIVFVGTPWPLADRFHQTGVPYRLLGLSRGRHAVLHPRRCANEVTSVGADGALLVERGFMAAVLRAGGYKGPIVAVEHGALLEELQSHLTPRRVLRELGRIAGSWADDVEVAVSDFMLEKMRVRAHASITTRIYNGIDTSVFGHVPEPPIDDDHRLVVGFAGRLVQGKGADNLIRAVKQASTRIPIKLLIAGDGPERSGLAAEVEALDLTTNVEFLGVVDDMPTFWRGCDVAAIPSGSWESFSMVTLEAMSCGRAVVATSSGAIPELVVNAATGTLVPPGDIDALTSALAMYFERPELRREHGLAARQRAIAQFHIKDCAEAYYDLFNQLSTKRASNPIPPSPRQAEGRKKAMPGE